MDYIYLISIGFKEETHTKNEFQNSGNLPKCLSGNKSTARKRNKHRTKKNFTIDSTMMIVNEQRLAWSNDNKQLQSIRKISFLNQFFLNIRTQAVIRH